jgi:predicted methyltransferase
MAIVVLLRIPDSSGRMRVLGAMLLAISALFLLVKNARADGAEQASEVAQALGLKPGMVVAEVGAGKGATTVEVAKIVGPSGRVYSTEVDPKLVNAIKRAVEKTGLDNVEVKDVSQTDTGLPENCCDVIFMRGVYHHFTNPDVMDGGFFRALRPGGKLFVFDFWPSWWLAVFRVKGIPPTHHGHGVEPEIVTQEATAAGFTKTAEVDNSPSSWILRTYRLEFQKPAHATAR